MIRILKILSVLFVLVTSSFHTVDAFASLAWDTPGVNPVQSISDRRWRDANTGRFITPPPAGGTTLNPVTPPVTPPVRPPTTPPVTPPVTPPTTPPVTPTVTPPTTPPVTPTVTPPVTPTAPKPKWYHPAKLSKSAKLGAALGAIGGTAMMIDSASGSGPHSWGSVLEGAAGGAMLGLSVGTVFPVIGNAIGAAGGTVIGGAVGGSQLFSETDCEVDPALNVFTCCHTQFNKGERYADIGHDMFCPFPNVKTCLNGGSTETKNLLKDDFWGTCFERFCEGTPKPSSLEGVLYVPILYKNNSQACWNWACDEENGYDIDANTNTCVKGNNPVPGPDGTTQDTTSSVDSLIQKLEAMRLEIIKQCL